MSMRSSKTVIKKLFDSGFWLAILFIVEPHMIVFGLLIFLSVFVFQTFTIRSVIVVVTGFITPMIMYFTYWFWIDQLETFYKLFFLYADYNYTLYASNSYLVPITIIGILSLVSITLITPRVSLIRGSYRRYWILIIAYFLIATTYVMICYNRNGTEFLCLFFPVSILLANWMEGLRYRLLKDIVLGLFIFFSFVGSAIIS